MSLPKSPFAASKSTPGNGELVLALFPPGKQILQSCTYQYPLKLITPDPHTVGDEKHVTVAFLLTYGGGLVGGDQINLKVELQDATRLVLVTQGSTKIFKSPSRTVVSRQILDVKIGAQAALCYLPDPTQPFAESVYEQKQTFYVDPSGKSSLLMLDWVTEGRRARGESWTLWSWKGRNEVREFDERSRGRLLLRDAVMLHEDELGTTGLVDKSNNLGIFGTLIVYGPLFEKLGGFLVQQFAQHPRIGAKNWTQNDHTGAEHVDAVRKDAELSKQREKEDGLLWTAAHVRGFVLVKFGAKELDGARRWLAGLLKQEGTVEKEFGHQALLCLR
jgi:urease accessory protein